MLAYSPSWDEVMSILWKVELLSVHHFTHKYFLSSWLVNQIVRGNFYVFQDVALCNYLFFRTINSFEAEYDWCRPFSQLWSDSISFSSLHLTLHFLWKFRSEWFIYMPKGINTISLFDMSGRQTAILDSIWRQFILESCSLWMLKFLLLACYYRVACLTHDRIHESKR